jgi:hypothetical protein
MRPFALRSGKITRTGTDDGSSRDEGTMNKSLLAALNDSERLLVAETEKPALEALDEDAVVELHARVRRARNKYTGQYRRGASARVSAKGGRGKARPANQRAALKAEAFEEALSRVSRRLGVLANETAKELRDERIAAARRAPGEKPVAAKKASAKRKTGSGAVPASRTNRPRGDRSLKSPVKAKKRASTGAMGAKRQAKRDSKRG